MPFSDKDVFVNVVGGVRLEEPGADLAVGLALVSSLREVPVSSTLVAFGEVGLAGEVRAVDMVRQRVAEAAKFGFTNCVLPKSSMSHAEGGGDMELVPIGKVAQAIETALEI